MAHIGPFVQLNDPLFIHDTAQLHGKVCIEKNVSIWANVVTRCEQFEIVIGAGSNIQDFVMIHEGAQTPTLVGRNCSITHHVTLHGCSIGDNCLIGINATIMDGAVIGANSIVAGHAIVSEGSVFPENSVIGGVPAKQISSRNCSVANMANAAYYRQLAACYADGRDRI
ncbi:MAG TPA: gamma carbonic anhydrase family protein [Gammaproteobacteria bacterium]|nr:gamma carbonic anhydrase family protein [Gammaproteobacteria bacterium]HIK69891.1 gamma carbonic anhydrase family protein [Pseudomonadales bacterium]